MACDASFIPLKQAYKESVMKISQKLVNNLKKISCHLLAVNKVTLIYTALVLKLLGGGLFNAWRCLSLIGGLLKPVLVLVESIPFEVFEYL